MRVHQGQTRIVFEFERAGIVLKCPCIFFRTLRSPVRLLLRDPRAVWPILINKIRWYILGNFVVNLREWWFWRRERRTGRGFRLAFVMCVLVPLVVGLARFAMSYQAGHPASEIYTCYTRGDADFNARAFEISCMIVECDRRNHFTISLREAAGSMLWVAFALWLGLGSCLSVGLVACQLPRERDLGLTPLLAVTGVKVKVVTPLMRTWEGGVGSQLSVGMSAETVLAPAPLAVRSVL